MCAKSQPPRPSTRLYNTWVCSVFCTARGIDFERVHRRCSCWAKKCSANTSDGGVPGGSTLGHTPEAAATLICTAFCTARAIDFAELARLSHGCERLSSDCSLFLQKILHLVRFSSVFSSNKKEVGWGWVGGNLCEGKHRY